MMTKFLIFIIFFVLFLLNTVLTRPLTMQRIRINNHEFEVPDEPGWEDVIRDAELVQRSIFSTCTTPADCSRIIDEMRKVFLRHSVSRRFFEDTQTESEDIINSIFKWG